ncbi:hypothetical protein B0I27_11633 [Arcticibacter pallidicorallinus]|uniref:Uncharacterized protein n=1 Tax=Arcticibacter pallidicorallinus TaxID=1259464 RepID=A0A2T0TR30_9SPHI|nr:hypothetical protein [Arcticibacter pallidicorallinus]PRY48099.1 hypothetical protein B0I27_11633 [Arcticibacter pallidicorallinus]
MKSTLIIFVTLLTFTAQAQNIDIFTTTVTFPSNYVVGDYVEFSQASPVAAAASGYYEISIAYTRGNIAAAATHIASASHANPDVWREAGRTNNNVYTSSNEFYNFTIDVNPAVHKFRIRAVNTLGIDTPLPVEIKIRSINFSSGFTALSYRGNSTSTTGYLPMTNDWDLIVGNLWNSANGVQAIRALSNGYVGINTRNPTTHLDVNGKIRAKEIKVEAENWPDYVFDSSYELPSLEHTDRFIKANRHLPGIPSAAEVSAGGIELGQMNSKLLQKIEELTLHLIDQAKEITVLKKIVNEQLSK